MIKRQTSKVVARVDSEPRTVPEINFVGAICVILLFGYLLRAFCRRIQKNDQSNIAAAMNYLHQICKVIDSLLGVFHQKSQQNKQANPMAMVGHLCKISRMTGHSEYDIFCKSAEDWPISDDRINRDFKKYLYDQSLPFYVNDFVRKNHNNLEKLKERKNEVEHTSRLDWAKALLVFPGSFLFLVLVAIFLL
ncbi:MAG: hypothetical protein JRF56_20635 [Deltaproteobacteria bacterium]|jgi:hypothetical protein|nr:hypothetical protein [Deltaproteobacteria bacterium]